MSGVSPGWYRDQRGEAEYRWWDGEKWTDGTYSPSTGGRAKSGMSTLMKVLLLTVVPLVIGGFLVFIYLIFVVTHLGIAEEPANDGVDHTPGVSVSASLSPTTQPQNG